MSTNEFDQMIQPYIPKLRGYCRVIARNQWDADDLYQETLLKIYALLSREQPPIISKAYLYRIATNTWIDLTRRNKGGQYDIQYSDLIKVNENVAMVDSWDALALIIEQLPLRQSIVLLLSDVFSFKAKEIALMLSLSEGAVKAILHRSKDKLKKVQEIEQELTRNYIQNGSVRILVDNFLKAIREGKPTIIVREYFRLSSIGTKIDRITNKGENSFSFRDPDGNLFFACS